MASEDAMVAKVLSDLKDTPYACTSLIQLSGGFANFTYRGALMTPLVDGSSSIVIKHAEPFSATNSSFKLDIIRSHYEQTMLTALTTLPPTVHSNIHVTTPRLYQYTPSTATQIVEDYQSAVELKDYVTRHDVPPADIARLGTALGSWLKSFHIWGAEQTLLRETIKRNSGMKQLKYFVNYGRLLQTVDLFPDLLGESRHVFEEIAESYQREAEESSGELIHGDFWPGNILLRDGLIPPPTPSSPPLQLFIIDWELSQLSSHAFDLGQCLAELFLLHHFRALTAGADMMEAFVTGYGAPLDDGEAFRVALAFGVHLVVWPCRVPGWGQGEIMERCVRYGRDCCVHAWARDREWFQVGVLGSLFAPGRMNC